MSPIFFASFIHIIFQVTIFFDLPKNYSTISPSISSRIVFLAVYFIIQDINPLLTKNYPDLSKVSRMFIETVYNIFIIELFMVFIWCQLEMCIESICKFFLANHYYDWNGDKIVGWIIFAFSIYICYLSMMATNFLNFKLITIKGFNRIKSINSSRSRLRAKTLCKQCSMEICCDKNKCVNKECIFNNLEN